MGVLGKTVQSFEVHNEGRVHGSVEAGRGGRLSQLEVMPRGCALSIVWAQWGAWHARK